MRGLWDAAQFRFTGFIDSENPFLDRIVSRDALLFMIYQISRPVLMGVKVFTDSRGWFNPLNSVSRSIRKLKHLKEAKLCV